MNKQSNVVSAAKWAAKAETKPEQPPVTAPLILPSGVTIEVCRPDLDMWFTSGALPQVFVDHLLAAGDPDSERTEELKARVTEAMNDPTNARQAMIFMRTAVTAAVVRPKIKVGAKGDDEIEPSAIPPADFKFIFQYVMSGCPGVPVETEGGQVSVEDLQTFRDEQAVRQDGVDVRPAENSDKPVSKNKRPRDGVRARPRRRRVEQHQQP